MDHGCIRKIMENDELQERLYFRIPDDTVGTGWDAKGSPSGIQESQLAEYPGYEFLYLSGEWVTLLDMSKYSIGASGQPYEYGNRCICLFRKYSFQGKELRKLPPGGIPGCGISLYQRKSNKNNVIPGNELIWIISCFAGTENGGMDN